MTVIDLDGVIVLTDPVFRLLGLPASPRTYTVDCLPRSDLILISHRHFDHWDAWTMRRLPKETPLVVRPGRIARDARRLGYAWVQELPPWEETRLAGLCVTSVPAVHMGGEVGFVVQGERGGGVYFGGDTSFDAGLFAAIGERFDLDLALLPIGRLCMGGRSAHMGPAQAVEALKLLRPRVVVGIHWGGVARLSPLIEMPGTPQELARLAAEAGLAVAVRGMAPLETVEV